MVGGSGRPTARVDRLRHPPRKLICVVLLVAAAPAAASCVYFNTYYNANRLFQEGVKEIEEGRGSSGRATLGTSIEKAERIVLTKPNSRWVDDALRLIVRARLLREEWQEARDAAESLLRYSSSQRDSTEVAGFLGSAEFNLGNHERADSLITHALPVVTEEGRRAELLLYRGQARAELGRFDEADEDLRAVSSLRPDWVAVHVARARLLASLGRGSEAAGELQRLLDLNLDLVAQRSVLQTVEALAEIDPASTIEGLNAVDRSRLSNENKARLTKLRGDLHLKLGQEEEARADYRLTGDLAPLSTAASDGEFVILRLDLGRVSTSEEFEALKTRVERLASQPAGMRNPQLLRLNETLVKVAFWIAQGRLGLLLAAETARDNLKLEAFARHLFLRYAESEPDDPWVPKAILAALALAPVDSSASNGGGPEPSRDELRRRLVEDHRNSAYVQALIGGEAEVEFTYEELEQGLRRQLQRLEALADQEVRTRRRAVSQ